MRTNMGHFNLSIKIINNININKKRLKTHSSTYPTTQTTYVINFFYFSLSIYLSFSTNSLILSLDERTTILIIRPSLEPPPTKTTTLWPLCYLQIGLSPHIYLFLLIPYLETTYICLSST